MRINRKVNLENISNVSWKINLVLMRQSKSQEECGKQDATLGSERVGEVSGRKRIIYEKNSKQKKKTKHLLQTERISL